MKCVQLPDKISSEKSINNPGQTDKENWFNEKYQAFETNMQKNKSKNGFSIPKSTTRVVYKNNLHLTPSEPAVMVKLFPSRLT